MSNTTELSNAKRALLEKYLCGDLPQAATAAETIPRRSSRGPAPLSFGQEQLWFLAQLMPASSAFNESFIISFTGSLDVAALEQSLNEFIKRHEIWRTSFPAIDGRPAQVIYPVSNLKLSVVDLRNFPVTEQEGEALRLATEEAIQPFDFAHGPLLCAILVRLDNDNYRLFMTLHHIIVDAISINQIFLSELYTLYESFSKGKPSPLSSLSIQYADFASWEQESLQKDTFVKHLAYWKQQLADVPPVLDLPTDRPRPPVQSYRGSRQTFTLSGHLTDALKILSHQESVTLYMTLAAAFQALLYRYTRQDDLLLGTIISSRKHFDVQNVVGYFLNTVALRTNMSGNPAFRELLKRTHDVIISACQYVDIPFEHIVKELYPERNLSYHPLVQVILSYHPQLPTLPSGWAVSQMDVQTHTSKFDLCLELQDRPEGLIGRFIYNTDLFDDSTISRMVGHWQTLLEGIVADPSQHLADLPLLTEQERHQLLIEWNATQKDYPQDRRVHQLFEAQVERTPDAVAVVFEQQQLTYRELNARANQLAHHLQQLGVGPEVMVGLSVERSAEMIIGLLGILKAGGVYVPLDPEYPQERLSFLVQDTQMPILLTQQHLLSRLAQQPVHLLCLDSDWDTLAQQSEANPSSGVKEEHLAYVIYTSGSTGQPKGVLIPHHALAAHCWSIAQVYELRAEDRVLQFNTYTFDASLEQILPTLLVGARLVLRGQEVWSPAQLLKQIKQGQLRVINLPTAYWHQVAQEWMNEPEELLPHHLRLVIVGGDRLLPEALQLWRQMPLHAVRLLNAYGPTETTITATLYDTSNYTGGNTSCKSVPIGRPVPNRRVYILDRSGAPVPIGVPGELHIGGDLLARGYLNRPDLTAERFIADPFSANPHARLYKTGDMVRYLADGTIEFLGRVDQQVKIRGFRIELGEIEAVLCQHPEVREAVVVAREETPGEKYLAAYVVAQQGTKVQSQALRQALRSYLQQKLPSYMLPAAFVFLERLPLLSSGKIDRCILPAPKLTEEETFVAPRLLIHQQLVQIWQELLDVYPIGIRDNFFYLGGHSLLAARLVDHIKHVFGKSITLSAIFSGPTIEQLAETLQQQENLDVRTSVLPIRVSGSKRPFFFLHGDWTGGAFYCFTLARALGPDQPFYVLEPYKFSELQNLPSFETVAATHIEALRAIQPEGPYLLGGFCNGGLLAYEMARQLEAAGERVDFLALIAPSAPVQYEPLRALSKRMSKLLRLGVNSQAHLFLRVRHTLRHVYRTVRPSGERVQDFDKLLAIDPRLQRMFPPVEALYNDYVNVFNWVVSRYETGIYPGKITFFGQVKSQASKIHGVQ